MKEKIKQFLTLAHEADVNIAPLKAMQMMGLGAELMQLLEKEQKLALDVFEFLNEEQRAALVVLSILGAMASATKAIPKLP